MDANELSRYSVLELNIWNNNMDETYFITSNQIKFHVDIMTYYRDQFNKN